MVRDVAINDLSCDASCANVCTNGQYVWMSEVSECLSSCNCDAFDDLVDFEYKGKFNYQQLVVYSQGNMKLWNLFKQNKNRI
jgi:hypothetical protein